MIGIMAGIAACTPKYEPNHAVYSYDYEPVMVAMDASLNLPVVKTVYGEIFYVPGLLEKITFNEGDFYVVSFKYDTGNQDMDNVLTASDFVVVGEIRKVTTTAVAETEDVLDEYSEPISQIAYGKLLETYLFFQCIQNGAENQTYDYEAIFVADAKSDSREVTVYIRAKKTEPLLTATTTVQLSNFIGVDIAPLTTFYKENKFAQINVTYKYKTGEDAHGEIYATIGEQTIKLTDN
jgi:hypothetical protein